MNIEKHLERKENPYIRQVVLLVTQSCNLNCKYCYEHFKTSAIMSPSLCKQILENEFKNGINNPKTQFLAITFLGGEPLLNFGLIKEVSEWLWSKEQTIPYSLDIRTNGTLMTGDVKKWFAANKRKISAALSLDGLNENQKNNRTDKEIDYKFFIENWPESRVKIVLFKNSLNNFADTVKDMLAENIPLEVDVGFGFEWTTEDAVIFEKQLEALMDIYVDDLREGRISGIFPFSVEHFFKEVPANYPFCSRVNNIVSYDTDGTPYKCHMFTPVVLGEEKSAWINQHDFEYVRIPVDPLCKNCPIFHVCKPCPAQNLMICGDISCSANARTFCKMVKVQARACSMLFLKYVQLMMDNNIPIQQEELETAEKAMLLLKTIPEAKYL